jgi:hypothetical protein
MFVSIPGVSLSTPVKSVKTSNAIEAIDVSEETSESPTKQLKKDFKEKFCDIEWCAKPEKNYCRAVYIVVDQKSVLVCKLGHFRQSEEAAKLSALVSEMPVHIVAPFKCWWCAKSANNLYRIKSKKNSALELVVRINSLRFLGFLFPKLRH